MILRRPLQSRKDRLQVKGDKQNATKTTTLAKCSVLCLLEMLSGGQRARFVHAVSGRSSMSAVALLVETGGGVRDGPIMQVLPAETKSDATPPRGISGYLFTGS